MAEWDCSDYSIPELEEALGTVDGRRYPQNEAALRRELEARKASGEYERFMAQREKPAKQKRKDRIGFARRMRPVVAVYLLVSAAAFAAAVFVEQLSPAEHAASLLLALAFAAVAASAGLGLLLGKAWGHWVAVLVLAVQVVRFQLEGIVFSPPSLLGIYVQVGEGGTLGFNAELEVGFRFGWGTDAPMLFAVNLLAVALIAYLFTARKPVQPTEGLKK